MRNASLTALIIGSLLPDIDFLFLFFDWFNQVHRVITHNFFFILLASLLATVIAGKGGRQVAGLSLFLGGMLHIMIDSFMDNNPTNGIGIVLWWPLNEKFLSPFNIFQASLNAPGWNEPLAMVRSLIPGLLYEIPFYIIAAILFLRKNRKDHYNIRAAQQTLFQKSKN